MTLLRWLIGWHFLYEGLWKLFQAKGWSCFSYLDGAQGPLAGLFKWICSQGWLVAIGDWAVMLGLVAIGLSLITGVLSRLAAVFGILLMAMFYAAQPPEPFATAMSGADGRFFFFERNVIEIAALALVIVFPTWKGWRKTLLPGVGVLLVFGGCFYGLYRQKAFSAAEAVTSATVKVHEFTALASLRERLADTVDIGGVKVTRLALGGDLYSGHAHGRDLIWSDEFMRRYNTGGALERTIRHAVRCGIGSIFAEKTFLPLVKEQAANAGGKMAYFVNCATPEDARFAKDGRAEGVYTRPELTDELAKKGDVRALKALFDALKATGLVTGVGAENVETVRFCVSNGLIPDYWVLAFHSLDYPAATMKTRCNNIWCERPAEVAAYMKTRREPWVSIRGLAGGGIEPKAAFAYANANGVSVVALDLLDFRIVDTVNDVNSVLHPKADEKGAAKKEEGK